MSEKSFQQTKGVFDSENSFELEREIKLKIYFFAAILIFSMSIFSSEFKDAKYYQDIIDEQDRYIFDESKIVYRYLHIIYNEQKIINYFVVSGLEKEKVKFDDIDLKIILNFESYLQSLKFNDGVVVFKTTEHCLSQLSSSKNLPDLFLKENGPCNRFSKLENLGKTSFVFWYKKIYFIYRDFVDWL